MTHGGMSFEWAPGIPIEDEYEEVNVPSILMDRETRGNTGHDVLIFDDEVDDVGEVEDTPLVDEAGG